MKPEMGHGLTRTAQRTEKYKKQLFLSVSRFLHPEGFSLYVLCTL
jgi:hypothetical protein